MEEAGEGGQGGGRRKIHAVTAPVTRASATNLSMYIYICIYRERERERERLIALSQESIAVRLL